MMQLFSHSFLYTVYFRIITSHKVLSCIVRLVCHIQRFFPEMKLVKTLLCTQLKQTNLENRFHISTGSPKADCNDTVF